MPRILLLCLLTLGLALAAAPARRSTRCGTSSATPSGPGSPCPRTAGTCPGSNPTGDAAERVRAALAPAAAPGGSPPRPPGTWTATSGRATASSTRRTSAVTRTSTWCRSGWTARGSRTSPPVDKVQAQVMDDLPDDDRHLLVAHNRRDPQVFDVFRIDVATGEERLVAENPGNITGWLTDHDGRLRVAVATDGVSTSLLYRDRGAGAVPDPASPPASGRRWRRCSSPSTTGGCTWPPTAAGTRPPCSSSIRPRPRRAAAVTSTPTWTWSGLAYSRKRKVLTTRSVHHLEGAAGVLGSADAGHVQADRGPAARATKWSSPPATKRRGQVHRRHVQRPHPGPALPVRRGQPAS